MNLFIRMRDLAFLDPTLNAIFGPTSDTNKFRWFDRQLPQGQIERGPCAVVQTVSQITTYLHNGPNKRNRLLQDRVQISIAAKRPNDASDAAAAVDNFLDTANFVNNGAFASPPIVNVPGSNYKLNQRGSFYATQTASPIPVEVLEYRIYNVDF